MLAVIRQAAGLKERLVIRNSCTSKCASLTVFFSSFFLFQLISFEQDACGSKKAGWCLSYICLR